MDFLAAPIGFSYSNTEYRSQGNVPIDFGINSVNFRVNTVEHCFATFVLCWNRLGLLQNPFTYRNSEKYSDGCEEGNDTIGGMCAVPIKIPFLLPKLKLHQVNFHNKESRTICF